MVIILSSLLLLHNFRHASLIGSSTILNKIQKFPNFLWLYPFYLSIYFCFIVGTLWRNLQTWKSCCICEWDFVLLFCFVFPGEAYIFTLSWHHCHWRRGRSVRLWELACEVLNPYTHSPVSGTSSCLRVTIGHSSLDFTHNKVLKGNPEII